MVRVVLLVLFGAPICATAQPSICSPGIADPSMLAEYWLEPISRLYNAIPALSPREESWLESELASADDLTLDDLNEGADASRSLRAMRSSTYAMREAKWNAGSLLASLRILTKRLDPPEPRPQAAEWAFFAYSLIDYDAPSYLAILESEGIIEATEIPGEWAALAAADFSLTDSVRSQRTQLARHVLICIIPQVKDE